MKTFSLSKNERLKEKKIFDQLFKSGKTVLSKDNLLKAIYFSEKSEHFIVKIAVGISKKAGNAVWRNRLKRLIRNAYRLNKLKIVELAKQKGIRIHIVFSSVRLNQYNSPRLFYKDIESEVLSLLEIIYKKLNSVKETEK